MINLTIGWKLWQDLTALINWFEIEDIVQRLCVLFYLVFLFGYTTNIFYAFDTTYTSLIAFYLAARLFEALYFFWVAYLVPTITGTMLFNALVICLSAGIWIASIHVSYPNQLALIFIAIPIDLFGNLIIFWVMRVATRPHRAGHGWLNCHFDFFPAVNIEHRTERTNAFVSLVFGYSVLIFIFK